MVCLLAGSNDPYDTATINGIGVISLGITGEVYTSTKHVLTRLGVTGKANASLLKQLSFLAIEHTHKILRQRWQLDTERRAGIG